MSRSGARNGRRPPPGSEFSWAHESGATSATAPTPTYPSYDPPKAEKLSPREQSEVDRYRALRERFHEGPYYSILDAASTSAKKGSAARALFDPFHGMPSYAQRYVRRKRTLPKIQGRPYVLTFFPRELQRTLQPNYKPEMSAFSAGGVKGIGIKRGFEDDEEDQEEDSDAKRRKGDIDEDEEDEEKEGEDREIEEEEEEEQEGELEDNDFSEDDDDMGGDYNAEQYFDAGGDEGGYDAFGDGGGGGGDEDTF